MGIYPPDGWKTWFKSVIQCSMMGCSTRKDFFFSLATLASVIVMVGFSRIVALLVGVRHHGILKNVSISSFLNRCDGGGQGHSTGRSEWLEKARLLGDGKTRRPAGGQRQQRGRLRPQPHPPHRLPPRDPLKVFRLVLHFLISFYQFTRPRPAARVERRQRRRNGHRPWPLAMFHLLLSVRTDVKGSIWLSSCSWPTSSSLSVALMHLLLIQSNAE